MDSNDSGQRSAGEIMRLIRSKRDDFWRRERERRPLALFHAAARRVPAYRDFLRKNHIQSEKIKTFKDFAHVPPVDKKNYLREYPLEKLCWDGTLKKQLVFTSTSGSTGEPFYFPRSRQLDWEASIAHELFLANSSRGEGGPILAIVGFSMGVWIAGVFTYRAFELAAERNGYELSILTPGINKAEILSALERLGPHMKQVIIAGYPPLVKDVIDEAQARKINLKKLHLRLLFAAEPFTEKFRDHLAKKAGIKNPCLDTMNIYGSADIGVMAFETPAAILVRRLANRSEKLFSDLFSKISKTPTLAQYNPRFINFEAPRGDILLTGSSAVPLIRYAIGDHGGVFYFSDIMAALARHGVDFRKAAARAGIAKNIYELPFVYIYERSDFSTTLYGLQVYPESIRETLLHKRLSRYLTGKFTMLTKFDAKHDQYLELHLELRKDKRPHRRLEAHALKELVLNLRMKNSEFRELHNHLGARAHPKLVFWRYEHPLHFKAGIKQKWVKKQP